MSRFLSYAAIIAIAGLVGSSAVASAAQKYGFGKPVSQGEIAPWDIDINGQTGEGLPAGHGSVSEGAKIWEAKCASCHGVFGEGAGKFPVIAGGRGTLKDERPEKTVGSYWPYAPTLFDYIKRAMPFPAPQSLSNDEVYALTAYVLNLNDVVPATAVMDAKTLATVKMPNRDGFVKAAWDTKNVACMTDCKPGPVRITSDLVSLHVTPDEREVGNVGSTIDLATVASPTPTATAIASTPGAGRPASKTGGVSFATVGPIIAQRCTVCHAGKPTQSGFPSAPMGIKFDTPAEIKSQATKIKAQAVTTRLMPLANMTHMTDKERALLDQWISAGAPLR